jgi:hypothetical protein
MPVPQPCLKSSVLAAFDMIHQEDYGQYQETVEGNLNLKYIRKPH